MATQKELHDQINSFCAMCDWYDVADGQPRCLTNRAKQWAAVKGNSLTAFQERIVSMGLCGLAKVGEKEGVMESAGFTSSEEIFRQWSAKPRGHKIEYKSPSA